jgi:hypothetical protein
MGKQAAYYNNHIQEKVKTLLCSENYNSQLIYLKCIYLNKIFK